ncbi:MAG: radical SAM protein [Candidatus Altiarchaeota archaeon]|nr:radical SAM protein [Candidatus Altiarchaeota archaeon]
MLLNQDIGHLEDGVSAKIIRVGKGCNNHCITCNSCGKDFGNFSNALKKIQNKGNSEQVIFTGSEPAIQPGFIEAVKMSSNLEYRSIQVISNGRIFASGDFTKKALEAGLSEILIKFPSHKKDIFEKITRVPGSYEQTIQGIKNLKRRSKKFNYLFEAVVVCGIYITEDNNNEIQETVGFLEKLDVDEIFLINTGELKNIEVPKTKVPIFTLGFKSTNRYEDYVKKGVLSPKTTDF